jgi:cell division ATPase FtsA
MIKNLFYNLHVLIQKFMREHIAVVDLSNNITRIYLYEFDDNSHDFIGMEEATIDFSSKENAIAGLFKLVDKLEKQYDLIITKVIVNVPYHYIKIRNFKSKINYNKSYNKKDLAKIFHKKKIEKKLDKSEQFLFLLFKKLQFDNYDFKNILPKIFLIILM